MESNADRPRAKRMVSQAPATASSVLPTAITSDRPDRSGIREVDDEGANGDGGPGAEAEEEQRRDGEARRRPHRAGVFVRERQQQADAAGRNIADRQQREHDAAGHPDSAKRSDLSAVYRTSSAASFAAFSASVTA